MSGKETISHDLTPADLHRQQLFRSANLVALEAMQRRGSPVPGG
jgi:hypothetical protein